MALKFPQYTNALSACLSQLYDSLVHNGNNSCGIFMYSYQSIDVSRLKLPMPNYAYLTASMIKTLFDTFFVAVESTVLVVSSPGYLIRLFSAVTQTLFKLSFHC